MIFDSTFIILIPAMILAIYAQGKVQSTFNKYLKYRNAHGYTGADVARRLLDMNGLYDVPIEVIGGTLTDHYDPSTKVMRLSRDVYSGTSVAAIGVAAHETGHAIQHKEGYIPLTVRNLIVPVANFGSNLAWPLFLIGLIMGIPSLLDFGIILFSAVVIFQIITLPVEFNASNRAIRLLSSENILTDAEIKPAREVLNAAALTYLAATLTAILQLIRLIVLREERD
ncbi:zinc metallopeptidase [Calorimonas adulescens]|jgi:Putative neutral zinc metallopeptidase.|uniref:Zinc metallopeptidase n=1 Tax=Calorimonas adulescens TaxID=2606906 RepID=A0A5D8QFV9_9THEO|nr:zinc metallopeptidase [Calorimonas adulescens]TZE83412.1 zinc metallopeptidase [Calorimonas adulescens]